MKTFFIALILGIFVGLFINNYFADPQAYQKIKEAKTELFESPDPEIPAATEPLAEIEQAEPALFEVASKELSPSTPEPQEETKNLKPQPLPKPESLPEPESQADTPIEEATEAEQAEPPLTTKEKAEKFVEDSVEKATEIAENVKESVEKATEEAKPKIEEGIETGIDATIRLAILGQFKLEKRLQPSTIDVHVDDRIVTLSGSVPSDGTKQLAIEIAAFTKGVNGVEESLQIQP